MGKKHAFVNYGNSREGRAIADALKEEGYFVYATRRPDNLKLDHLQADPLSVDQFIDSNPETIIETMKMCNVIIYTILDTPKLCVEVLTKLNDEPGIRKTIVIVSPIFTWAGQPKAEDWKKRWPHPRYTEHLAAERYLTASLQLRIYVMCVGLLYGNGEGALLPLFQSAWHLKAAPMLEQNHNVIPTLHVKDMAHGAVALSQTRPEVPVIIAHDGSGKTQREIVKTINSTFGAGKTPKKTEVDSVKQLNREAVDWLMLDIELEAEDFNGLDFERHCSDPIEEFQTLVDEFVHDRLLTPLKILAVDIPSGLIKQVVDYYGLENGTVDRMKELFATDKSEDAMALKESAEDEEPVAESEIIKYILGNSPPFKNQGFIITHKLVPKDEEERENMFLEDEESAPYMPKYIITWHEFGPLEKWFISKGSHCATVKTLADVQKFLGLPRNFTRNVRILESRRQLEQIESERADNERKRIKKEREQEEARITALKQRDAELLREVQTELDSMKGIRELTARQYLMQYVVPMFQPPLAQINEARPDDPLRFLAAHFEKEAKKLA